MFVTTKRCDKPRGVLAVHYVNYENDIGCRQVALDLAPLVVGMGRAKVMRRNRQIEIVFTVDLALRLFQRRQQARPDVENSYSQFTSVLLSVT